MSMKSKQSHFFSFDVFFLPRDITSMYKEPPPGLYAVADENDITKVCEKSNRILESEIWLYFRESVCCYNVGIQKLQQEYPTLLF